jgi:hypothetical protein
LKDNSKVTSLSYCVDDESWRILEKDVQSLLQQGLTDDPSPVEKHTFRLENNGCM